MSEYKLKDRDKIEVDVGDVRYYEKLLREKLPPFAALLHVHYPTAFEKAPEEEWEDVTDRICVFPMNATESPLSVSKFKIENNRIWRRK